MRQISFLSEHNQNLNLTNQYSSCQYFFPPIYLCNTISKDWCPAKGKLSLIAIALYLVSYILYSTHKINFTHKLFQCQHVNTHKTKFIFIILSKALYLYVCSKTSLILFNILFWFFCIDILIIFNITAWLISAMQLYKL